MFQEWVFMVRRRRVHIGMLGLLLGVGVLSSLVYSSTGSVNLAATLNDAPAFTPVDWKVLNVEKNTVVGESHAHSLNMPLSPGTYKAVAVHGGKTRERVFTVGALGQVNVVIAMD